jgi:hypothetical protein
MLCSDWSVPLREDQRFRPLDLMNLRQPRSGRTGSPLDLIVVMGLRSKGWG